MTSTVYLGLGSNLGDRMLYLDSAVALLEESGISVTARSSVLETDPVDFLQQPKFLNLVIRGETSLDAEVLLAVLQDIEKKIGRVRDIPKGPRVIDIDILLYDDRVIQQDNLIVPHPQICSRFFVLKHLCEINPDIVNPLTGRKYQEILNGKERS